MKYFLTIFAMVLLAVSAFAQADPAPGDLVINELGVVATGTDSTEFIEIYNKTGSTIDMNSVVIQLVNGSNGGVYSAITGVGTVAAGDYFVLGQAWIPNVDQVWALNNVLQNGDPDAVRMIRKSDLANLDAVGYFTQYDTVPGTAENGTLPASAYEGVGGAGEGGSDTTNNQIGLSYSARTDVTIGRFPDGSDTNDNFTDFHNMFAGRTPGTSNSGYFSTVTENFSTAGGFIREWADAAAKVLLDTTASAVPAAIPNSPDPVTPDQWASVKDNTGGGDGAVINNILAQNYNVSGQFYCGPISSLSASTEVGGLMVRMTGSAHINNTRPFYDITQPIGLYGDSYYGLEMDYITGAVSAINVFKCTRSVLTTSAPLSIGWHKLEINCVDSTITFFVDGAPALYNLTGQSPRVGFVGVGYRVTSGGTPLGSVRNNFDDLRVGTAAPEGTPVELSSFKTD